MGAAPKDLDIFFDGLFQIIIKITKLINNESMYTATYQRPTAFDAMGFTYENHSLQMSSLEPDKVFCNYSELNVASPIETAWRGDTYQGEYVPCCLPTDQSIMCDLLSSSFQLEFTRYQSMKNTLPRRLQPDISLLAKYRENIKYRIPQPRLHRRKIGNVIKKQTRGANRIFDDLATTFQVIGIEIFAAVTQYKKGRRGRSTIYNKERGIEELLTVSEDDPLLQRSASKFDTLKTICDNHLKPMDNMNLRDYDLNYTNQETPLVGHNSLLMYPISNDQFSFENTPCLQQLQDCAPPLCTQATTYYIRNLGIPMIQADMFSISTFGDESDNDGSYEDIYLEYLNPASIDGYKESTSLLRYLRERLSLTRMTNWIQNHTR